MPAVASGETVSVRLDDALVGRLPPVCVMTGARADGYVPLVVPKRLGIAWALLLAGPIGAAVLIALWSKLRVRYRVRVPMSAAAFDRLHALWAWRVWCAALGFAGIVLALVTRWLGVVSLLIAFASLISLWVALAAHWRAPWAQPTLVADSGGRWVTMQGVHARFKAAVAQEARR